MPIRYTPAELPEFQRDFTWATHLNDIRWLARENMSAAGAHLLAELKCLLLFHAPNVVLSDTDILNSSLFHAIFHYNADGIRNVIQQGIILPAYRDTIGGLTELNGRQGDRRANKNLYLLVSRLEG
ncbi:MAG: hypothetical protein DYG94_15030 [Leptolyngbya sp. PLA3]|nr:MAG: hypothetical protein EDM82_15325 [Cyanobacteria bacterium CYA]MCE7970042.1 hypothetical protein [Leptolyngbya sp. PL-A3]